MSMSSLSSLSDIEFDLDDVEDQIPRPRFPNRADLFSELNGEEFRLKYRISKETLIKILGHLDLEHLTKRNKAIDGLSQLMICMRFFAKGSIQEVMKELTNIHKSSVCRIVQRATLQLAELAPTYIKMPEGEEIKKVAEEFHAIDRFPQVIGALGSTHVKIVNSRGRMLTEAYRCKKGHFSINVQVVCDAKLRIRDIIARWPGSVHPSTIFNNSHLYADFESGKYGNYCLLGDNVYYNKEYLLTPFLQPQNYEEAIYNNSLISTRFPVERCIDVWKHRCPCLETGITLNKISTVLQTIVASAVLHNMCIELEEDPPPNDFKLDELTEETVTQQYIETSVRTALVNSVFSQH